MGKHIHAELMLQYAQDAMETETPWERWECLEKDDDEWSELGINPRFHPDVKYRRKPKTININGFEVPEPLREAPKDGTTYYPVYIPTIAGEWWAGDNGDKICLWEGLAHSTIEGARLHREALLSLTKVKDGNQ